MQTPLIYHEQWKQRREISWEISWKLRGIDLSFHIWMMKIRSQSEVLMWECQPAHVNLLIKDVEIVTDFTTITTILITTISHQYHPAIKNYSSWGWGGTWVAQLVECLGFSSGPELRDLGLSLTSSSVFSVQSACDSLLPLPRPCHMHTLVPSLSLK